MSIHRTAPTFRVFAALLFAAGLAACASGSKDRGVRTAVKLQPIPEAAVDALPPSLPLSQVAQVDRPQQRISLQANQDDIRQVLQTIARGVGMGFQISPEVQGRITTRLQQVPLQQALDEIVTRSGFSYEIRDGVLFVGPARLVTEIFSLDYVSLSRAGTATTSVQRRLGGGTGGAGAGAGGGGAGGAAGAGGDAITSTSIADLWNEIQVALNGLVFDPIVGAEGEEGGEGEAPAAAPAGAAGQAQATGPSSRSDPSGRKLIINPMAGTIMVVAPAATMASVRAYLAAFEGAVLRQVSIEAKIVEVILSQEREYGIDWDFVRRAGNATLNVGSGIVTQGGVELRLPGGAGQISAVLTAMETQGDVRVLSSPQTSTLNNQRAIFDVSTDEIFFTVSRERIVGPGGTVDFNTNISPQTISVGIILDVLPQISANNVVTMSIRPTITDVLRVERLELPDGTQTSAPVTDRRSLDTVARVRSGETIVIGGLIQERTEDRRSGVPILMDIPFLGRLFSHTRETTERRELVIFLTPTVMAGQPQGGGF